MSVGWWADSNGEPLDPTMPVEIPREEGDEGIHFDNETHYDQWALSQGLYDCHPEVTGL